MLITTKLFQVAWPRPAPVILECDVHEKAGTEGSGGLSLTSPLLLFPNLLFCNLDGVIRLQSLCAGEDAVDMLDYQRYSLCVYLHKTNASAPPPIGGLEALRSLQQSAWSISWRLNLASV